jgi:CRP-like cAMP-binding protein
VIREGEAEALVDAPGGESVVVGRIGAGEIFGEMALVEAGTCGATVRATGNVDGWFTGFEDFRALVMQRQPAARELQHAVTVVIAERLRAVNERLAALESAEDAPARAQAAAQDTLAGFARTRHAAFGMEGFLPRLAFFGRFAVNDIDEVVASARVVEVPRGVVLHAAGSEATAVYIVVRGAVEVVRPRGAFERRIAVLGPGRPAGFLAVLLGTTHGAHCIVREDATLLEIPAPEFRRLYFGEEATGTRLRSAVQRHLLESLGRTNRALTRFATHARLHSAGPEATAWEAARHAGLAGAVQSR